MRTVALLPQAREALVTLPEREGLVFRSKRGLRAGAADDVRLLVAGARIYRS